MTQLTRRAAIYRAKRPRPAIDAKYHPTIGTAEVYGSRRFTLTGSGANVGAALFRARGHDVEVAECDR